MRRVHLRVMMGMKCKALKDELALILQSGTVNKHFAMVSKLQNRLQQVACYIKLKLYALSVYLCKWELTYIRLMRYYSLEWTYTKSSSFLLIADVATNAK